MKREKQEKFYFNPGDTGFKVFCTKFGNIGVAVCWDQWFPEAARAMALQGAEVRLVTRLNVLCCLRRSILAETLQCLHACPVGAHVGAE